MIGHTSTEYTTSKASFIAVFPTSYAPEGPHRVWQPVGSNAHAMFASAGDTNYVFNAQLVNGRIVPPLPVPGSMHVSTTGRCMRRSSTGMGFPMEVFTVQSFISLASDLRELSRTSILLWCLPFSCLGRDVILRTSRLIWRPWSTVSPTALRAARRACFWELSSTPTTLPGELCAPAISARFLHNTWEPPPSVGG